MSSRRGIRRRPPPAPAGRRARRAATAAAPAPVPTRRRGADHALGEAGEQVAAVVGTGAGLGVVLHAERVGVAGGEALADAVVEVDVGQVGDAGQRVDRDREVVVLRRDLDRPRREVLDGVVGAVVAERQLDRRAAERPGQQLVAEADAEDRDAGAEQVGEDRRRAGDLGRVARPVAQEDAVGVAGDDVGGRRRGRHDLDRAEAGEVAQDRALDAVVVGHDPERRSPTAHGVRLGASSRSRRGRCRRCRAPRAPR